MRRLELIGRKFDRLEVIGFGGLNVHYHTLWKCKCDCGNELIVEGLRLTGFHTRSCGCYHRQRTSEVHKGKIGLRKEKNGHWNPYRTHDQRVKDRKLLDNVNWRNLVFKRDNYTCQKCGDDSGGNLVGHHIISYTNSEELRFDVPNGITLCMRCHKEFHGIYGYGNNTENQLKLFLNK